MKRDTVASDQERVAAGLRDLAACSSTVLNIVSLADPQLIIAQPDKIGTLLQKVGDALVAATEGLAKLHELRVQAAAATPPGPGTAARQNPLVGTLEAIRAARRGQAS
jgi:hypothetical protein